MSHHSLIISDVDGTLLDARGHFPGGAAEFARLIRQRHVVLASSRTLAELLHLQAALDLRAPLLAENGALVAYDDGWLGLHDGARLDMRGRTLRVLALGAPADVVEPIVREAAEWSHITYRTLEDILEDEARAGRLHAHADRERALQRTHSVLIEPMGGAAAMAAFRSRLAARDCRASLGGRWTVIVRGSDKGAAVQTLVALMRRATGEAPRTLGIGNAENDLDLLGACDERYVVRSDDGVADARLAAVTGAVVLDTPGIGGWLEMLRRPVLTSGGEET